MNKFIDFILQNFKKELLVLGLLGIVSSCTSLIMNYSLKYAVDYCLSKRGNTAVDCCYLVPDHGDQHLCDRPTGRGISG